VGENPTHSGKSPTYTPGILSKVDNFPHFLTTKPLAKINFTYLKMH